MRSDEREGGMSTRPEIKVFLKAQDGGGYVDLAAWWRGENGMLQGRFDRSVRAIKVVLKDGSEKVVRVNEKGYADGHYLNIRIEEGGAPAAAKPGYTRTAPVTRRGASDDMPADDFVEDSDIPF